MKRIDGIHNPAQIKIGFIRMKYIRNPKLQDYLHAHIEGPFYRHGGLINYLKEKISGSKN
jgi:hypothetical protein